MVSDHPSPGMPTGKGFAGFLRDLRDGQPYLIHRRKEEEQ